MRISLIAAVAEGGVIGFEGRLPWRLPADLRRFRHLTMGHHLLMGRKTWESVGRPLPGREILVISRRQLLLPAGVRRSASLEEALTTARDAGEDEAFVAGGGEIYRLALPLADRLYLTRLAAPFPGDAFFPELDESAWRLTAREDHGPDGEAGYPVSFLTYDRRPAS